MLGNPIYGCGTVGNGADVPSRALYMRRRREAFARNVQETKERLEREREEQGREERERVR